MYYIPLRYAESNSAPEIWSQISISSIFFNFLDFRANWTFGVAWKKLWSQNWKPKQIFRDTTHALADAYWSGIIDLWCTKHFCAPDFTQSSKNTQKVIQPAYIVPTFDGPRFAQLTTIRIVFLVWTSHIIYTTIRPSQFSSRNLVSDINFIDFFTSFSISVRTEHLE